MEIVPEIGDTLHQTSHGIPQDAIFYLFMDNVGGHGLMMQPHNTLAFCWIYTD